MRPKQPSPPCVCSHRLLSRLCDHMRPRVGSDRHSEVMSRITEYLEIGKYMEWSEEERLKFLNHELVSKRPLVPPGIYFSNDELAVVNAFRCRAAL